MNKPKSYEVNTPRLNLRFLCGIVDEINSINTIISPLREQRKGALAKVALLEAKKVEVEERKEAAKSAAQVKADAKASRIAQAKAIIAEAKRRDEALEAAKKLLKETTNEK